MVPTERSSLGPSYRKLWTASAVSNLGDGVRLTALPLLAASLTRDPLAVSAVFVLGFLPWLVLSLVAGALVDRWDRRVVMVWSNAFRTVGVGLLGVATLAGLASLPLLYAVAFLLGAAETLFDNAAQAFLPQIIGREDLEKANGRMFAAEIVTNQFLGPPIGGFLFAVAAGLPFLLDSGSFAASAVLIFAIAGVRRQRQVSEPLRRLPAEIGEGLRWLWGHRLLRTLAVMLGLLNLLSMATSGIFVLFAQEILGLSSAGFGVVLAAFGIGSAFGALLATRVSASIGSGRALFLTVLSFGITSLVIGSTSDPILVGAMFALAGFFGLVWNVLTVSLRQSIIPEQLLGRVNSVYRFVGWGSIPLGGVLGGVLAGAFGLRSPFYVAGTVFVVMAFLSIPIVNNRTIAAARESVGAAGPVRR